MKKLLKFKLAKRPPYDSTTIPIFTLKSVDDARVPDCNLHYGSLLPAKLSIEVNKQTYNYEFFSCKLDEEFSWTELNNRPESIKETKTINDLRVQESFKH
jgi:hypothetical protein